MTRKVKNGTRQLFDVVDFLVARRKELGHSQDFVADGIKISRESFNRWERYVSTPSGKHLFKWAAFLGVELVPSVPVTDNVSLPAAA